MDTLKVSLRSCNIDVTNRKTQLARFHKAEKRWEKKWLHIETVNFIIAGHAAEFDDVIIEGSLEDLAFAAYYIKYVEDTQSHNPHYILIEYETVRLTGGGMPPPFQ